MKKSIALIIALIMIITLIPCSYASDTDYYFYDSFEENKLWNKISSSLDDGIFERADDEKTDGNYSLKIYDNSKELSSGVRSGTKAIDIYHSYTLTADIKIVSGSADLIFRSYDASKKEIERKTVTATDREWKSYTVDIEPMEGVIYYEVLVQTSKENIGELYLDNVKIVKDGKLFIPGNEASSSMLDNAQPGDTFVIPDGVYENISVNIKGKGASQSPITLKSKNPGNVIFTGASSFSISGTNIILSDLIFNECTNQNPNYIVYFSVGSSDSQLKDCAFINCNPQVINTETQLDIIYVRGQRHKITSCYFNKKSSIGRMINIENKDMKDDEHIPGYHTIESCYFGNFLSYKENEAFSGVSSANGFEAIKIGSSSNSMYSSFTTIKGCFFEKCNGEDELITVKSSENSILNNTFYRSSAAVHLRQGHDSIVKGNLFINDIEKIDAKILRSSGLRVYDKNHTITDNYFYNQPENTGALFLDSATENGTVDQFAPITNINASNNTVIGADIGLVAGMYYKNSEGQEVRKIPPEGKVENNALISYKGSLPLIYNGDTETHKHGLIFKNNYAYGKELGYAGSLPEGINNEPFAVSVIDGFVIPKNQTGADIEELKKAPENPFEIIPGWIKEKFYDTNEFTFETAKYDLLNNKDARLNDLVYFKASHDIEAGEGEIKLYKDGVLIEENPVTLSHNPTLNFIAEAQSDYSFKAWYVNGIEITEENAEIMGVIINNNTLTINNQVKDIDITASFSKKPQIPEKLEASISSLSGKDITVVNHKGERASISGYYKLVATKVTLLDGIKISEWGFLISTDLVNYDIPAKSLTLLNESGGYGMLIYNLKPDTQYGIKAYAIYEDSNGNPVTVTGDAEIFTVSK